MDCFSLFPLQYYLNAHKYRNAETAELWDALQTKVHVLYKVKAHVLIRY